eukprot:CAMPEP_0201593552 /NCGR_PEP_ID=MMETSP0190_2-20130828/191123_1 /ASSEMBLY_ACC=CAM_ASM_000263 /TAXON_ID=37353 /ORGANISM="Rosalina sp." /LENGTH=158 /DNA_ID=CAMNT_0048052787 /DNA_START=160 /DNA_END=636 /DNA_ORIENTATION=+
MMNILSTFTALLLTASYQVYGESLFFNIQAAYIGDIQPGSDAWKNLEDKIDEDPYYLRITCTRDSGKEYEKDIGKWEYKVSKDEMTQIWKHDTFDFGNDHRFSDCKLNLREDEIFDDSHGDYYISRQDVIDGKSHQIDAEFDDHRRVVFTVQLFDIIN